jgi:hypothetical protein
VILTSIRSPAAQHFSNATFIDSVTQAAVNVELQRLVNPSGYSFDALPVATIPSIPVFGKATTSETWFPGFAWRTLYVTLPECQQFMGWRFTEDHRGAAAQHNLPPTFDLILFNTLTQCATDSSGIGVTSSGPLVSVSVQVNSTNAEFI